MSPASDVVTVERFIPAPPEKIFALLADPSRHRDIDGSGSVRDAKGQADRLALGSEFGISMRIGLPYSMVNTVTEYDDNRRIAWQPRLAGPLGRFAGGGRTWRYELEPVEGGTQVRETWDISEESPLTKPVIKRAASSTKKNMEATLARIEELVTT